MIFASARHYRFAPLSVMEGTLSKRREILRRGQLIRRKGQRGDRPVGDKGPPGQPQPEQARREEQRQRGGEEHHQREEEFDPQSQRDPSVRQFSPL